MDRSPEPPRTFGKYRLHERIGSGGMAEVYRATLPGVGGFERTVAIKRMRPAVATDPAMVRLFVEEAKLAARIHHKNVVQVFELGEHAPGEYFIAMEYIRGTDLRRVHEHCARAGRSIPPWLAIHVVEQALDGLEHIHHLPPDEGIPGKLVHCDVTPENILIGRTGDVKLADFGVAVDRAQGRGGGGEQAKGKLPYMSPEQLMEQPLDARTDVFAASVVLWECLTGRRLFPGRTPSEVMAQVCASPRPPPSRFQPALPSELDRVVLAALSADKERRPATAEAFRRELKAVLVALGDPVGADELRDAIASILDAPVTHPDAEPLAGPEDDGYDELEELDLRHEGPDLPIEPPEEAPSWTASQTVPRMRAARRPTSELDELMRAYLEDERTPSRPTPAVLVLERPGPSRAPRSTSEALPLGTRTTGEWPILGSPDSADAAPTSDLGRASTPPPVLAGGAPLYRRPDSESEGPYAPSDVLGWLAGKAREPSGAATAQVSVDRVRWVGASEVARLLGEADLPETAPPSEGPLSGSLAERSLLSVLGAAARIRGGGRLRIAHERPGQRISIELHVRDGMLTHVRWTGAPFETWRSLFDDPRLGARGLPEAFSAAIGTGTPVLPRLPAGVASRVDGARSRASWRWLERAAGWTSGWFGFDPQPAPHVGSKVQPIMRLLPGLVYCAFDAGGAERRVAAHLNAPHRLAGFDALWEALGLTAAEAERIRQLESGSPLRVEAGRMARDVNPRFVWGMVLLLTELGVLLPS